MQKKYCICKAAVEKSSSSKSAKAGSAFGETLAHGIINMLEYPHREKSNVRSKENEKLYRPNPLGKFEAKSSNHHEEVEAIMPINIISMKVM